MAVVQRAHGRDHSDLFAGLVPVRDAVAQRFYGVNDGGFLGHGRYSADLFLRRARGRCIETKGCRCDVRRGGHHLVPGVDQTEGDGRTGALQGSCGAVGNDQPGVGNQS